MRTASENKEAPFGHGTHYHFCGRCGWGMTDQARRCPTCGADLMTMADCIPPKITTLIETRTDTNQEADGHV